MDIQATTNQVLKMQVLLKTRLLAEFSIVRLQLSLISHGTFLRARISIQEVSLNLKTQLLVG